MNLFNYYNLGSVGVSGLDFSIALGFGFYIGNLAGRTASYIHHFMDKSPHATQLVTPNSELPPAIVGKIMRNLPAGSTIQFRKVCRACQEVPKEDATEALITKARSIFKQIKQRQESQERWWKHPSKISSEDILFLIQNNFISLDQAHQHSYSLVNRDSFQSYSDNDLRTDIGLEYFKRGDLLNADSCTTREDWRDGKELPTSIFRSYLELYDFDQCIKIYNKHSSDLVSYNSGWGRPSIKVKPLPNSGQVVYFYSMIQKAYEMNHFDAVLKILSLVHPDDETIWAGCIVALKAMLIEKGDLTKASQLDQFKSAFQIDSNRGQLLYYVYTSAWRKAESLAILMKEDTHEQKWDKCIFLTCIRDGYHKEGLADDGTRIDTLMVPFLREFS